MPTRPVRSRTPPGGGDRVSPRQQVVEPVRGDPGDLDERGGVLLLRRVLEPLTALGDDLVERVAVAYGHDQREPELLAVGRGQLAELLVLLVAQDRQAQGGLVAHRARAGITRGDGRGAEVRVRRDELALLLVGRGEEGLLEGATQVAGVLERPAIPGSLHRPRRALVDRAEGVREVLAAHLVDLVEGDFVSGPASNGRAAVAAHMVEDEV